MISDTKEGLAPVELQINNVARTWERVTEAVSWEFGIPVGLMTGASKRWECVQSRRIVCKVLYQLGWSYSRIGRNMGRDHTSVRGLICQPTDQAAANRIETELRNNINVEARPVPTGIKTFKTVELLEELIRRDADPIKIDVKESFIYGDDVW